MQRLLLALVLLAAPAVAHAQIPKPFRCSVEVPDAPSCSVAGASWYMDSRDLTMHYLVRNTDWLKLSGSGTTLTLSSNQGTLLSFSDALSLDSTLAVTGAVTVTGAATFNGTVTSKYFSIDFESMPTTTGIGLAQSDWTAYDSTAATLNMITTGYGTIYGMTIVDAGNSVPVLDATGLDITAGNVTENDHVSYWSNWGPGEDRAFIAETDGVKFCVDMKVADVTGTDAHYCGFRSLDPVTVAIASYTDYCAIGHISGNYGTQDKTTGATDSGSDAIADTEEDTWCITMAASTGVCTYTIDGVAVASADTHDFAAGTPVIPFCQLLHDADGADDTLIGQWNLTKP